jgi:hypothetical protein
LDDTLKSELLELLDHRRIMTLATNRPDGRPQATSAGYVSDGLTIYFLCSPQSRKAANLAPDSRISLSVEQDVSDLMAITNLSMAAQRSQSPIRPKLAKVVSLRHEIPRICGGVPDAETGGNRGLPCVSQGDLHPRLPKRF